MELMLIDPASSPRYSLPFTFICLADYSVLLLASSNETNGVSPAATLMMLLFIFLSITAVSFGFVQQSVSDKLLPMTAVDPREIRRKKTKALVLHALSGLYLYLATVYVLIYALWLCSVSNEALGTRRVVIRYPTLSILLLFVPQVLLRSYNKLRAKMIRFRICFEISVWKLRQNLPILLITLETLFQEFQTFVVFVNEILNEDFDENYTEDRVARVKSATMKYGVAMRYLGRGTLFEVTARASPFGDSTHKGLNIEGSKPQKFLEAKSYLEREANVLKHLLSFRSTHPRIHLPVLLRDLSDDTPPSIECLPVGEKTLAKFLKQHCTSNSHGLQFKRSLMGWFGCTLICVRFLHDKARVLHTDIKATNFVISRGRIYLIDYSTSQILTAESNYTCSDRIVNSPKYSAPELFSHDTIGFFSDIFPLGCLYLQMLTALCEVHPSLLDKTETNGLDDRHWSDPDKLNWIVTKHLPSLRYKCVESLCTIEDFQAIKAVIASMLSASPTDRPTASSIRLPRPFQSRCCWIPGPEQSDSDHIGKSAVQAPEIDALGFTGCAIREVSGREIDSSPSPSHAERYLNIIIRDDTHTHRKTSMQLQDPVQSTGSIPHIVVDTVSSSDAETPSLTRSASSASSHASFNQLASSPDMPQTPADAPLPAAQHSTYIGSLDLLQRAALQQPQTEVLQGLLDPNPAKAWNHASVLENDTDRVDMVYFNKLVRLVNNQQHLEVRPINRIKTWPSEGPRAC
ncbi:hypothetical protein PV08_11045 [Exophiala spinifera]|uniref:non-specific serine/threonine protein kinase n=1 Tax=Exophiala spinifera TaxID=91928 RepID=A0A0D2AUD4_9EURO|nr:uncharacterized protein PV08_11045 [Exophiala spinifera]KIW10085.1 hypothetical protein PV08_11045 [Exophiala spinifera]